MLAPLPYDKTKIKGTAYDGGTHVLFVVSGPDVVAGQAASMTHLVDLFSTVLELSTLDGSATRAKLDIDWLAPLLRGSVSLGIRS